MALDLEALYQTPDRVVVTAHRGFSGQYPENTMPAFHAAVALGVAILEFDLRGTRDGVPIVLHDPTLDRTTNRPGTPGDYTLAEIQMLEASHWQGSHEAGIKLSEPALPGTCIPTFEQVLDGVGQNVGLNIQIYDTSPAMLAEVCRLYNVYDLYGRGYLTMSTFEEAARVRAIDPAVELCVTARQGQMDLAALQRQRDFGCRYVQPLRRDVTPEFCAAARSLGLYANMFFANSDADSRLYVEMGIQGILTDHPDIVIATLQTMGRR